MVTHTCNPRTGEVETGKSEEERRRPLGLSGQAPRLMRDPVSLNKVNTAWGMIP